MKNQVALGDFYIGSSRNWESWDVMDGLFVIDQGAPLLHEACCVVLTGISSQKSCTWTAGKSECHHVLSGPFVGSGTLLCITVYHMQSSMDPFWLCKTSNSQTLHGTAIGLPRNGQGWWFGGSVWGGSPSWQSQTGRVWDRRVGHGSTSTPFLTSLTPSPIRWLDPEVHGQRYLRPSRIVQT